METSLPPVVIEIDMTVAQPGRRALIFPNTPDELSLGEALNLDVWGDRARFHLPSSETTPSAWIAGMGTVGSVINKPCSGWAATIDGDQQRAHYERAPCAICDQPIRTPHTKVGKTASVRKPWRGEWNPATPMTPDFTGPDFNQDW